jgi:hypothetical protein
VFSKGLGLGIEGNRSWIHKAGEKVPQVSKGLLRRWVLQFLLSLSLRLS